MNQSKLAFKKNLKFLLVAIEKCALRRMAYGVTTKCPTHPQIALAQFQSIVTMESPCSKGDGPNADQHSIESTEPKLETIAGRSLMVVHLRPKKEVDR